MKAKEARTLILILAAVLVALVGFGQGCGPSGVQSNGGGYGGMVPRLDGDYGSGGPNLPTSGSNELFVYLRYGTGASCTYPAALTAVGAFLSGAISYNPTSSLWFHRATACASPTSIADPSTIAYADYNVNAAVYGGQLYLFQNPPPTTTVNLERQRMLCRRISSAPGALFQAGTDVLVTTRGGFVYATIVIGRSVSGTGKRYVVDPFLAIEAAFGGGAQFTAPSFVLETTPSAGGTISGRLRATISGEALDLTLDCHE